jgi:hypothetical protein
MIDAHGLLLYRDIFDWQMPAAHFLFIGIGRLIGYTNAAAARWVDIASLVVLLGLTGWWLKRLGWKTAWSAAILFGVVYLCSGMAGIMEREYFALIPLAGALVALTSERLSTRAKAFSVGLLFGLLTALKPIMGLGLPPVLGYLYFEIRDGAETDRVMVRRVLPEAGLAILGFILPVGAMIGYLAANGTLSTLIGIAQNYWPLFSSISFSLDTRALISVAPEDRVSHLLRQYFAFGGQPLWLLPAFAGGAITLRSGSLGVKEKWLAMLILGMAAIYSIYAAVSGQFWRYHWFPFQYFIIAAAALVFAAPEANFPRLARWLAVLALCIAALQYEAIPSAASILWERWALHEPPPSARTDQANRIATYLKEHMQPGDKVQGLDLVSGGVVQAMLIADVPPATRFYIDDGFYFHVSEPYIQRLRKEFIEELGEAQPRFIVEAGVRPYLQGPDTSGRFDELQMLIVAHYQIVDQAGDYTIYERRAPWAAGDTQAIVAYPYQQGDITPWFRDETGIQMIGITPEQNTAEEIAARLDTAQDEAVIVSTAFINLEQGDPDRLIEDRAGRRWFFIAEYWSKQSRVVRYLAAPDACTDHDSVDVAFGGAVTLQSATSNAVTAGNNQVICAALRWESTGEDARPLKVALHVVDAGGNLIAQYDGALAVGEDGQRIAIELPGGLAAGKYRLRVIVYDAETGQRLETGPGIDAWEMGEFEVGK